MNKAFLLALAVALSGCGETKEQTMAQCRLEAEKVGANENKITHMTVLCMESKGFKFDYAIEVCSSMTGGPFANSYYVATCYK